MLESDAAIDTADLCIVKAAAAATSGHGGHDGGEVMGRRRAKGSSKTVDPRTHMWGAALITYSDRHRGLIIQCTCHRSRSHANPDPSKKSECRKTFKVGPHFREL